MFFDHDDEVREVLRERPLVGKFPYVFLDGLWLKRLIAGPGRHSPPNLDSRQVLKSSSPLAFHAYAPIYIPVAKTRIPAVPVTYERICGST
jgi:hypothetical protein